MLLRLNLYQANECRFSFSLKWAGGLVVGISHANGGLSLDPTFVWKASIIYRGYEFRSLMIR